MCFIFLASQIYSKYEQYADVVTGADGWQKDLERPIRFAGRQGVAANFIGLFFITPTAAYGHLSVTFCILLLHFI
jgi:hypothetical protein